jgi:hypothetical protein
VQQLITGNDHITACDACCNIFSKVDSTDRYAHLCCRVSHYHNNREIGGDHDHGDGEPATRRHREDSNITAASIEDGDTSLEAVLGHNGMIDNATNTAAYHNHNHHHSVTINTGHTGHIDMSNDPVMAARHAAAIVNSNLVSPRAPMAYHNHHTNNNNNTGHGHSNGNGNDHNRAPGDDDPPVTTPRIDSKQGVMYGGDAPHLVSPSQQQSQLQSVNSSDNDSSDIPSRSLYLGGIRAEQTSYYDLCRLANYVWHTIPLC